MGGGFAVFNSPPGGGLSGGASPPQINLSIHESVPGIMLGVVSVFGEVVSDALDNHFGIVAAGQSAIGVGPVVFGLAFAAGGHRPVAMPVVAKVPRRLGRVFVNREVAEGVDGIAFLARLNDEFFGEFSVGESG